MIDLIRYEDLLAAVQPQIDKIQQSVWGDYFESDLLCELLLIFPYIQIESEYIAFFTVPKWVGGDLFEISFGETWGLSVYDTNLNPMRRNNLTREQLRSEIIRAIQQRI